MATLINDRVDNPAESGVERYVGLEHLEADSLRIRRWGEITDVESTKLRFQPGDIIFGKRRVYQKKLAVADFEGICSAHAMVLRARANVVLPEFLPFFMQSDLFMERALAISVGSLSPTINWTTLAAEQFALPPIEEQRRLAHVLWRSEDFVEALRNAGKRAHEAQAAIVGAAVLNAAHIRGTSGDLQPGWTMRMAADLCAAPVTKGATPQDALSNNNTGIPFLKVYNLTFTGELDSSVSPTFITPRGHQCLSRSAVRAGDVLMNIVGPPLGKVSRVPPHFPEANINQAIARFRPVTEEIGDWLTAYLLSPSAQSWLHARSKKTSGQRNLTLETCRELPVPIPPPGTLTLLLSRVRAVGEAVGALTSRSSRASEFRQSLLDRALELGHV